MVWTAPMDPLTHIVTALAAGATAASQATADSAVKGTYAALRAAVREKYPLAAAGVEVLETEPGSTDLQTYVREKLSSAGAAEDGELFAQAQALLKAIQSRAPEIAGPIGVNLAGVVAAGDIYIQGIYITQNITYLAPSASAILTSPPPPDTFAGRRTELDRLTAILLKTGGAAISAAIAGMGGVGKSTVARKLGTDLAERFPGGVLWVDLGYDASQDDVISRLALRLGMDLADEPQLERRAMRVQHELEQRGRLLAILDDLWDVDLGRWLAREVLPADRAVLVTSRDAALSRALCHHVERLDTLGEAEALELLANILGPLGQHEATAKEVARLLEGLPLALELAAKLCDEGAADLLWLLRQLHARPTLGVLRLPGRETPESSVEASLAVSYGRLGPDLQRRFRALGAFAPAPFDLVALAAVWGDADETAEFGLDLDAAEAAARVLVGRGLLGRAESRLEGGDEALSYPVYSQHSLLRAYALALLDQQKQEKEEVTGRHVAYGQWMAGSSWQLGDLFWEQVEQGWRWAWEAGPGPALAYYHGVKQLLRLRGRQRAHNEWAGELVGLSEEALPSEERGSLLHNMGLAYDDLGEKQQALELFEQALAIVRQAGDKSGEATTLIGMGAVYSSLGEQRQALALFQQALPLRRLAGDKAGEAQVLNNMGAVFDTLGEKQRALDLYEQVLSIIRLVGDIKGEATALNNMGRVYDSIGEKQRALELYEQALPLRCLVGDRVGEAATLTNMGLVYDALGEEDQALEQYEQALVIMRQVENRAGEAATLTNLGSVYTARGEQQQALDCFEQALLLQLQVGDRNGQATTLNNMAFIFFQQQQPGLSVEMLRRATQLDEESEAVAQLAGHLFNLAFVLHSALGQTPEAMDRVSRSIAILQQHGLPLDANGYTLAQHQDFLEQMRSSVALASPGEPPPPFSSDLIPRTIAALRGSPAEKVAWAQYLSTLQSSAGDPAFDDLIAAIQSALFGGDLGRSGQGLTGTYAELWQAIIAGAVGDLGVP